MVRRVGGPAEQDTWKPQPSRVVTWRDVRRAGEGSAESFVHRSWSRAERGAADFDLDDEMLRAKG